MKKKALLTASLGLAFLAAPNLSATNGDKLIGVGPYSRSMGGVGIATPCCAITAAFANPATLSTIAGTQFDFGASLFMPSPRARVKSPAPPAGVGNWTGNSQDAPFPVPAIVIRTPIDKNWSFGLAAVGVAGMGVDYRGKDPMNTNTNLSVMQFSPAVAYKMGNLSLGLGLNMDFNSADFGAGEAHNYAFGAHLGLLYKFGDFAFGATYRTPQTVNHERVYDFNGDGRYDNLKLANPQEFGFGISWTPTPKFLVETDVKWLDWYGAKGYHDFDWKSQWVFAIGMEYRVTPQIRLRCGYNYGRNPVHDHDGWNPSTGTKKVAGNTMGQFGYEYFRIVGFPGIVEHHLTFGVGYDVSEDVTFNFAVVRGFQNKIKEKSAGGAIELVSTLDETSLDFGITWKF